MMEIRERLARIETKLDMLVSLEPRLRAVETAQANGAGKNTILGALAGAVMAVIVSWTTRHFT